MKPHPYFEKLGFSAEQIQAARNSYAMMFREFANSINSGKIKVSEPEIYISSNLSFAKDIEAGECDGLPLVRLRMNYYLTGKREALLP